jgi:predicted nucleotidyltransferase component of viral defense system
MTKPEPISIRAHQDPILFREALTYTAASTRFAVRLIEKDYFCTVALAYFVQAGAGLVFKGGTALAKVHMGFYRLSEDLDFTIPMPISATRRQRSQAARALGAAVGKISVMLPEFAVEEALTGSNNSTQYNAVIQYASPLTGQPETIRIEVSLREPLLSGPVGGKARTMVRHPLTDKPLVPDLPVPCIGGTEALAEKFRAALTRREVAIRDFYDLHHASVRLGLKVDNAELIAMVAHKLGVPGNPPMDLGEERVEQLRRQRESRLRPVLRAQDFDAFDLDAAIAIVQQMARKLFGD